MRMKQLKEKLVRSRSSLPPRISSYSKSRIVEDGSSHGTTRNTTRGNNCSSNKNKLYYRYNKWINKELYYICKFIHFLSAAIYFCYPFPIIMIAVLYDLITASIVGFQLLLLKIFILDLFLFKVGNIQNWPNNKVSRNNSNECSVNNTNHTTVLVLQCAQWVVCDCISYTINSVQKETNHNILLT
jgi:hypothetical protein